jgi:hypothetical protein
MAPPEAPFPLEELMMNQVSRLTTRALEMAMAQALQEPVALEWVQLPE